MKENEKLQRCFASLEEQLFKIKSAVLTRHIPVSQYIIDDIVTGGIFACDSEDSQDYIYSYLSRIDELINYVPSMINEIDVQDKLKDSDNPFSREIISGEQLKGQLLDKILSELISYREGLTNILNQVNDKMTSLGSTRFSKAGYKIKLDLNNGEIGSLFNTLYETHIISHHKSDGSELTKDQLADFISKNFSSRTKEHFSSKDIKNKLTRDYKSEVKIEKALTEMKSFISH